MDDLKKIIEEQGGKNKEAAKFALKLIEKVNILSTEEHVDDAIVSLEDYTVATQDRELKRRLIGRKLIVLKGKSHLVTI